MHKASNIRGSPWAEAPFASPCTAADGGHHHHLSSQEPGHLSHPHGHGSPASEERPGAHKGGALGPREAIRPPQDHEQGLGQSLG